jgi:hypothetical protein
MLFEPRCGKLPGMLAVGLVLTLVPPSLAQQPTTRLATQTEPPIETVNTPRAPDILLAPGVSQVVSAKAPFKTIHITDPSVVDIVVVSDRSAILVPKAAGKTSIDFLDEKSAFATVNVFVGNDAGYRMIEIRNKALITSATNFRCGRGECLFVGETTVQEPASLPRGHSEQSLTSNNNNVNVNR